MTPPEEVLVEAARLAAERRPFALATVVSVRPPASTRRGDRGLVMADGTLVGWVGGACSEPIVIREALRSLGDGRARLVRIAPPGSSDGSPDGASESSDDVILAESHCASGGTVEVLIQPQLPALQLAVLGEAPAARMLGELARTIGWRVREELADDPDAVVVATMGRMDEDLLAAGLRTGARYVGLVASARRAGVVLGSLRERGFDDEQLARVRSPAGLDLGPGSQEEIAVAILAELVACFHDRRRGAGAEALDPVCGMLVALTARAETSIHAGVSYWFCGPGCRARFEAEPELYLAAAETAPPGRGP